MTQNVNANLEIAKVLRKIADQGWRANITLSSGEEILQVFITQEDLESGAFQVERIGERHLKPRLLWVKDVVKVTPDWS